MIGNPPGGSPHPSKSAREARTPSLPLHKLTGQYIPLSSPRDAPCALVFAEEESLGLSSGGTAAHPRAGAGTTSIMLQDEGGPRQQGARVTPMLGSRELG